MVNPNDIDDEYQFAARIFKELFDGSEDSVGIYMDSLVNSDIDVDDESEREWARNVYLYLANAAVSGIELAIAAMSECRSVDELATSLCYDVDQTALDILGEMMKRVSDDAVGGGADIAFGDLPKELREYIAGILGMTEGEVEGKYGDVLSVSAIDARTGGNVDLAKMLSEGIMPSSAVLARHVPFGSGSGGSGEQHSVDSMVDYFRDDN